VLDDDSLLLAYEDARLAAIIRLRGAGDAVVPAAWTDLAAGKVVLTTEDPAFVSDPVPIDVHRQDGSVRVRFARPGAIVVRSVVDDR
jgi:hypothetical protein